MREPRESVPRPLTVPNQRKEKLEARHSQRLPDTHLTFPGAASIPHDADDDRAQVTIERVSIEAAGRTTQVSLHPRLTIFTEFSPASLDHLANQLATGIGEAVSPGRSALPRPFISSLLQFGPSDLFDCRSTNEVAVQPWKTLVSHASQLSLLIPRGTPLVLAEPFQALDRDQLAAALLAVRELSRSHQVLYLTEDERMVASSGHFCGRGDGSIVHVRRAVEDSEIPLEAVTAPSGA